MTTKHLFLSLIFKAPPQYKDPETNDMILCTPRRKKQAYHRQIPSKPTFTPFSLRQKLITTKNANRMTNLFCSSRFYFCFVYSNISIHWVATNAVFSIRVNWMEIVMHPFSDFQEILLRWRVSMYVTQANIFRHEDKKKDLYYCCFNFDYDNRCYIRDGKFSI